MYSLHVLANFPNEEREWDYPTAMNLGALEDAIDAVVDGNYDATSFIFTVVRIPNANNL